MNNAKLNYRISISLFAIAIIAILINYYLNYDAVVVTFTQLGYPSYLIHVLGVAQTIGLIILLFNKGKWILEWAYAAFFMNFTFGIIAHLVSKDGNGATAVICLILVWVTYIQNKKLKYYKESASEENRRKSTKLQKVA